MQRDRRRLFRRNTMAQRITLSIRGQRFRVCAAAGSMSLRASNREDHISADSSRDTRRIRVQPPLVPQA